MVAPQHTALIIDATVLRHAEDAAFYWSQLDWTLRSPELGFPRLEHFNKLLQAHLDGLNIAGPTGWKISALLQSVLMQASLYTGATGAIRAQASRRLQR